MWQGTPHSLQPCVSNSLLSGSLSPRDAAELMAPVKTCQIVCKICLPRFQTFKKLSLQIAPELRKITPESRQAPSGNSLANQDSEQHTTTPNLSEVPPNLSDRFCKPAQLEHARTNNLISQRPDTLKQWEDILAYVFSV